LISDNEEFSNFCQKILSVFRLFVHWVMLDVIFSIMNC